MCLTGRFTNLILAVLGQGSREVAHVSSIGEDAGHALPQQLVSVNLGRSGCLLLFPVLLRHQQPPAVQHLRRRQHRVTTDRSRFAFNNSIANFCSVRGLSAASQVLPWPEV